jgi:hypothetical protein
MNLRNGRCKPDARCEIQDAKYNTRTRDVHLDSQIRSYPSRPMKKAAVIREKYCCVAIGQDLAEFDSKIQE